VQPPLGGLHSSAGLFARPTPGAARGLRDGRARDGRAVAGAHAPGPVPGVTTVGCAAVARLWGQAGRSAHPAAGALGGQSAREPRAPGPRCIAAAQRRSVRRQLAHERVAIALAGAAGAKGDTGGVVGVREGGDSPRRLVDLPSDIQRARLGQG